MCVGAFMLYSSSHFWDSDDIFSLVKKRAKVPFHMDLGLWKSWICSWVIFNSEYLLWKFLKLWVYYSVHTLLHHVCTDSCIYNCFQNWINLLLQCWQMQYMQMLVLLLQILWVRKNSSTQFSLLKSFHWIYLKEKYGYTSNKYKQQQQQKLKAKTNQTKTPNSIKQPPPPKNLNTTHAQKNCR